MAARGPIGLHTHWGGVEQARPTGGDPAALVRTQIDWLEERGLRPRFFAGGGWYMDEAVATVTAKSLLATRTLLILIVAEPSFVTRISRCAPSAPAATGSKSIFVGSEHTKPACAPAGGP